jgi:hypothetical protein
MKNGNQVHSQHMDKGKSGNIIIISSKNKQTFIMSVVQAQCDINEEWESGSFTAHRQRKDK